MQATIYSKPNCIYCTKAKAFFDMNSISYDEKVLDIDYTKEELLEKFPGVRTLPQILVENEYVGGYDQLVAKFGK